MKQQPGVMLYFETRPCLERLSLEDQGLLFRAILDYGEYGAEPDFEYMLGIAWDFIKPRLDRDRERYETVCEKRRQAILTRWERQSEQEQNTNEYTEYQPQPQPQSQPQPQTQTQPQNQ